MSIVDTKGILSRIVLDTEARQTGDGKWMAKCPAHDDGKASLSIAKGKKHPVILNCLAGCSTDAVLGALNLTMADVMADRDDYSAWQRPKQSSNGKPKTEVPIGTLPEGVSIDTSSKQKSRIVKTYDYRDADDNLQFQVVRKEPKNFIQRQPKPGPDGGWQWDLKGIEETVLYRLSEVLEADDVLLVEGEKDADNAAKYLGMTATTNAGGAKKFKQHHAEFLRDKRVTIIPDNDDSGRNHVKQVQGSVRRRRRKRHAHWNCQTCHRKATSLTGSKPAALVMTCGN